MGEMHGVRRVITFCLLTAVLPTVLLVIPLYLRHSLYADVSYSVAESDVLEAVEGISSVFCQEQILRMNSTFRAFQLKQMPPMSNQKKHIPLKKSMILPDDTVEYWGFYLLAGSNISLLACSRYVGAGVIVVKGQKHLKTCQSMESLHKNVKYQKSSHPTKLPKEDIIRVDKLNEHQRDSKPVQNKVTSHISMKSYNRGLSEEGIDELDELTRDIKDYVANYSKQSRTQKFFKNLSTELSEHHNPSQRNNNFEGVDISTSYNNRNVKVNRNETDKVVQHRNAVNLLTKQLEDNNNNDDDDSEMDSEEHVRIKRKNELFVPGRILDAGVGHGGNANITEQPGESSDSSFEESLRKCYDGQDLLSADINPSFHCYSNYSLKNHKVATLQISSDGYYYFIFYSDNDHNNNPLHAHFDIFKTTYQHTNFSRGCINQTECKFPITFWSSEIVIVEVPTRDGIEHEDGDASVLVSSCYPRMSIYAIFPVAVLFLILGCAFL